MPNIHRYTSYKTYLYAVQKQSDQGLAISEIYNTVKWGFKWNRRNKFLLLYKTRARTNRLSYSGHCLWILKLYCPQFRMKKIKIQKLKIDLIDPITTANVSFSAWMMGSFPFSVWVGFGYCVFSSACLHETFTINALREFELTKLYFFRNQIE